MTNSPYNIATFDPVTYELGSGYLFFLAWYQGVTCFNLKEALYQPFSKMWSKGMRIVIRLSRGYVQLTIPRFAEVLQFDDVCKLDFGVQVGKLQR